MKKYKLMVQVVLLLMVIILILSVFLIFKSFSIGNKQPNSAIEVVEKFNNYVYEFIPKWQQTYIKYMVDAKPNRVLEVSDENTKYYNVEAVEDEDNGIITKSDFYYVSENYDEICVAFNDNIYCDTLGGHKKEAMFIYAKKYIINDDLEDYMSTLKEDVANKVDTDIEYNDNQNIKIMVNEYDTDLTGSMEQKVSKREHAKLVKTLVTYTVDVKKETFTKKESK